MAEIQNISIELVKVHPNNVRKTYNDIEELAESIKAKGILQNLTVVPDPQEPGKRKSSVPSTSCSNKSVGKKSSLQPAGIDYTGRDAGCRTIFGTDTLFGK